MPTLSLPPDVVGAIFQFLKPAHVFDAAPTAKAWAEAGESKLVWAGLVAQTVDTAVRDTLAVGGASKRRESGRGRAKRPRALRS